MDEAPLRRRLGCWGWLWIAMGCLGAVAGAGMIWVRSTTDLDAERERAVALGLPMTWEALGIAGRPGPDAAVFARMVPVVARAKRYDGSNTNYGWQPFCPTPPELIAWQSAGGSGVDADLDHLIGQLSGQLAWGVDAPGIASASAAGHAKALIERLPAWDNSFDYDDIYQQRSAAGIDDPIKLESLLGRLVMSSQPTSVSGHLVTLSLAHLWRTHLLRYRDRVPASTCAEHAQAIAERLDAAAALTIASEPLRLDLLLRLPSEPMFKELGIPLPMIMEYRIGRDFFFRSGRAPIIARAIDAAAWCRSHGLPKTCAEIILASPAPSQLTLWDLRTAFLASALENYRFHRGGTRFASTHFMLSLHLRITTSLRLLAADLEGATWPSDPGDPAGSPLHEIRRDGRLIGAYSFGPDGRDDGGDIRNDWCFALREQLGSPKASDPPPKP